MIATLAIHGGTPIRATPFPVWNTIDDAEIAACTRVLKTGVLSAFIGGWTDAFFGGPEVQALEQAWAQFFHCAHAVTVNSATSGLYAAIGALGIGPGDEVIVSPMSMSASATAPLIYGAIPVFADVDPRTGALDPASVAQKISPRTKAILAVNIFGHPADLTSLRKIADTHHLALIEDNAQAPGARWHEHYAGTIGDIGIFSLNCHKHIQTGEGGVCVTNNAHLAERLQLIRNHAEAVVENKNETDLTNLVGYNYRITEITAAIGREQLKKLPAVLEEKCTAAEALRSALARVPGLTPPHVADHARHVYYLFPLQIDAEKFGCTREQFCTALKAEGIPIVPRYVKPLYLAPMFAKRTAIGNANFPFSLAHESVQYHTGLCPVAERMYNHTLCYIPWCAYRITQDDVRDIVRAIEKIAAQSRTIS